jgi:hypothetical protein
MSEPTASTQMCPVVPTTLPRRCGHKCMGAADPPARQQLENISSVVLEAHQDIIRRYVRFICLTPTGGLRDAQRLAQQGVDDDAH